MGMESPVHPRRVFQFSRLRKIHDSTSMAPPTILACRRQEPGRIAARWLSTNQSPRAKHQNTKAVEAEGHRDCCREEMVPPYRRGLGRNGDGKAQSPLGVPPALDRLQPFNGGEVFVPAGDY